MIRPGKKTHHVLYLGSFADGSRPVKKCELYNPAATATVVDAPVGWCFFNLSADGKVDGIEYKTWGDIGVIDVPGGNYTSYFKGSFGCQCQIAPDNSNFFMGITDYAGGVHPDYVLWKKGGGRTGIFKPPAQSVGNPRWVYNATKSRCIVMKSPDGNSGNIYLTSFNDEMTSIQKTVKITSDGGCGWPAGWVGPLATSTVLHIRQTENIRFPDVSGTAISLHGKTIERGSRRLLPETVILVPDPNKPDLMLKRINAGRNGR